MWVNIPYMMDTLCQHDVHVEVMFTGHITAYGPTVSLSCELLLGVPKLCRPLVESVCLRENALYFSDWASLC